MPDNNPFIGDVIALLARSNHHLTRSACADPYRSATVKGGSAGLFAGVLVSGAGVYLASKRYPMFRSLSVPFRTFLVTSGGTFVGT